MIVIIEGLDGAGKSALANRIAAKLGCQVWHFPTENVEYHREEGKEYPVMHAMLEDMKHTMGSYHFFSTIGNHCVIDRLHISTWIYQNVYGGDIKMRKAFFRSAQSCVHNILRGWDIRYLYVKTPVSVAKTRLAVRGGDPSSWENVPDEVWEARARAYDDVFNHFGALFPGYRNFQAFALPGHLSEEEVFDWACRALGLWTGAPATPAIGQPLGYRKVKDDLPDLRYHYEGDSGFDLPCPEAFSIDAGETKLVPLGYSFDIPFGYELQVRLRSSTALKYTLLLPNAVGTIDAGYTGEVGLILHNFGKDALHIEAGTRLAQVVMAPVARADLVPVTVIPDKGRGARGYGSTGTGERVL